MTLLWGPSATEDSIWANLGREGSKGYFFLCGSKQPEKDERVEKLPSRSTSDEIVLSFHISFRYNYKFLCCFYSFNVFTSHSCEFQNHFHSEASDQLFPISEVLAHPDAAP